jgi:hypothetical protein
MKKPSKTNYKTVESKVDPRKNTVKETNNKVKTPKKKKVIISQENIQRNPKQDAKEVIEVVTRPDKFYSDTIRNEKNTVARSNLILTQP